MQGVGLFQQFRYGYERAWNEITANVLKVESNRVRRTARDTSGSSVFHQDQVVLSYDLLISLISHLTTNQFDNHLIDNRLISLG